MGLTQNCLNEKLAEVNKRWDIFENNGWTKTAKASCVICGFVREVSQLRELYRNAGCIKCINNNKHNNSLLLLTKQRNRLLKLFKKHLKSITIKKTVVVLDLQKIKDEIKEIGYELVSSFKSISKPISVKCNNGHIYTTSISGLRRGYRCTECRKKNIYDLKQKASDVGYELKSNEYLGFHEQHNFKCNECNHEFKSSYDNFFFRGSRCPKCSSSSAEKEIYTWLIELDQRVEIRNRKVLNGKELDIYLPEHKLAIEYCGLYWHSEKFNNHQYHLKKLNMCIERGIKLLTIFEDEWLKRKEQVKFFILSKLNLTKSIPARKCKCDVVPSEDALPFLNNYHILGPVSAIKHIGLTYNSELVQIISFSKHHRQNSKRMVLSRLCTKSNYTIVGGVSKLIAFANLVGLNDIITFADRRWSEGNVYRKTGFSEEKILPPDYSYIKNQNRYSKQSLKKTLEERLTDLTEKQLREQQGYLRIWDCGKIRFCYKTGIYG